jgi:hypothetical protein
MRRTVLGAQVLAAVGLAASLSGCVSTEQKAAWLHVENARIVASSDPTFVTTRSVQVRVTRVTMVRTGARLAIVVSLRNASGHPVNDIPITIGLRAPGRRPAYLNTAAGLDYFRTHLAEIPAQGSLTWVFVAYRAARPGERPFALAGTEAKLGIPAARTIPRLRVTASPLPGPGGRVRVSVTNLSETPQADVPVYVLAQATGRYLAAGSGAVATIAAGRTATTTLDLVGQTHGSRLTLEALPTLF